MYYVIAGVLLIAGPLWRALYMAHYPFLKPEAIVLLIAASALGVGIALFSRRLGGLAGSVMFGGLLFVFADLQLAPENWTYLALVLAGCIALSALLAPHRGFIVTAALGAFYVSSLGRPPFSVPPKLTTVSVARAENPVLVHIILDAQWGIGGLMAGGDTATAVFLREFYAERGFQLYEGAYSRFHETVESLPSFFSMGKAVQVSNAPARSKYLPDLRDLPYFALLRERGYNLHVFQSTYLDFCQSGHVTSCISEPYNSLRNTSALDGPWTMRAQWVLRYFGQNESRVLRRLIGSSDLWRRSVAGEGIRSLRELGRTLEETGEQHIEGGQALLAHVLLPHGPIDVDASCQILDMEERIHPREEASGNRRREIMDGWGDQSRCAHRILGETLDIIDRTIGRDRSIVVIHGDHGWRVNRRQDPNELLRDYSLAKLNNSFSTLFAIRRPGVTPSVVTEATPAQDLFWSLARSEFKGPVPTTWEHFVQKYPWRSGLIPEQRRLSAADMWWAPTTQ